MLLTCTDKKWFKSVEPLSIEFPETREQTDVPVKVKKTKRKGKEPTKRKTNTSMLPLDSPAMGTRSKKENEPC